MCACAVRVTIHYRAKGGKSTPHRQEVEVSQYRYSRFLETYQVPIVDLRATARRDLARAPRHAPFYSVHLDHGVRQQLQRPRRRLPCSKHARGAHRVPSKQQADQGRHAHSRPPCPRSSAHAWAGGSVSISTMHSQLRRIRGAPWPHRRVYGSLRRWLHVLQKRPPLSHRISPVPSLRKRFKWWLRFRWWGPHFPLRYLLRPLLSWLSMLPESGQFLHPSY